jgi:hypothetical protein
VGSNSKKDTFIFGFVKKKFVHHTRDSSRIRLFNCSAPLLSRARLTPPVATGRSLGSSSSSLLAKIQILAFYLGIK